MGDQRDLRHDNRSAPQLPGSHGGVGLPGPGEREPFDSGTDTPVGVTCSGSADSEKDLARARLRIGDSQISGPVARR